jgi:ABC-2 type transport system ATP-binding protein
VIAAEPVIAIDQLAKTYRSHFWSGRAISALRGVSLQVAPGEVFGLLGPNGAGKTTLIKILLGVVRATGGHASLFGHPAGSIQARRRVGYLPESLRIDRHHSARSALRYYGQMSRLSHQQITERMDPLLKLVGLENRDREPVRRFSKGMYQRLGLAQALMHDPDLLILDEPTDGLDPVGRSEVRRLLLELKSRGKTIFLNSHILQEVELVCDRVAIMSHGQVRGIGRIEELTNEVAGREVVVEFKTLAEPPTESTHAATTAGHPPLDALRLRIENAIGQDQPVPPTLSLDELPDGRKRLKFAGSDQKQTDAVVDWLRSNGYSILALKTHRRSLEDVFLELVGNSEADGGPQAGNVDKLPESDSSDVAQGAN